MTEATRRRFLVGVFPSGQDQVIAFEDIQGPLIAEAAAKVDAERVERERAARAVITVNRSWLLSVLRDLIAVKERDLTLAVRDGDYNRRCTAARKVNRLREDFAFCNAKAPPT
jgi:hypothetical protein